MSGESTPDALFEDGFFLSLLFDEFEAEEMQFQEVLTYFLIDAAGAPTEEAEEALMEDGESSSQSQTICDICLEEKEGSDMFRNELCLHSFCSDCLSKYAATKIRGSTKLVVPCPGMGCRGVLELDTCREKVSRDVVDRWDKMLCESLVPDSHKFYCPFRDCNAMLVNESDGDVTVRESECPICHRLFCAQCNTPWHDGIGCEELQKLNADERGREDRMVRELAKQKLWRRCPHCKYYVEKTQGCLHMSCRCGRQFCYACGATWSNTHGACQPRR